MSRRPVMAVALSTLLFSLPCSAAAWTVPGLANAPGRNGTFFASQLDLRNPGAAPVEATFELLPVTGAAGSPVRRTIAAGQTLVLPNVLGDLWGTGDRAGSVRVTAGSDLFISARTVNTADPSGTFGLAAEAVPDDGLLAAGQTGHVGWVSHSADGAKGFRTNVGVVLPVAGSSAEVVVFGATGAELGRRAFSGGPLAQQVSVTEIASGDLAVARLELRVTAGKATGYAAVVDNVTGDGFTVAPARITPGTWADLFLDGVSRGPGRFDTFFRTDVRLVNPGAGTRRVTLSGVSLTAGGQPFTASTTLEVGPGTTKEVVDVLKTLLDAPEGTSGSLRFEADGPLLVLGRTSNIRPDGSTFGAVQRTLAAADFLAVGQTGTFIGLAQTSAAPGFRTNVGFLAGPAGAVVDLTLRDAAGAVLATRPGAVTLASYAFTQPPMSDLFPGTAIPSDATLEARAADGTVDVYASFIDNGTGDPVIYSFLAPPVVLPGNVAATSPCPANPGAAGLINQGTTLSRVDIDTARYPDALCNDGTPGVFYVRKGTGTGANRWIVYLEGGGSCLSGNTCAQRWCSIGTNFGAAKMSNVYAPPKGVGGGGILATRDDNAFRDFNKAWVYYCSSDAWAGRAGSRPLVDDTGRAYTIHFQGGRILDAVVSELRAGLTYRDAATDQEVTLPSLDDAEVILFMGESAGSAGVLRNADRLKPYLEATNRTGHLVFRGLLDAANEPTNEAWPEYEAERRLALRTYAGLLGARFDESCLALHPVDTWRCADPAHLRTNHLTTPFFARQDLEDENVLGDFGEPGWEWGTQLSTFAQATWDHLDAITKARSTAEERAAMPLETGVYGPHCGNHTALRDNAKFYSDKVLVSGTLMSYHDTFRNWLVGAPPSVAMQPRPTGDPVPMSAVCNP